MKYFKTEPSRLAERYEITWENFSRETKGKSPFMQERKPGPNRTSFYAICPSCLNPIQIVGLSRTSKVRPYGRHTGKDVKYLQTWNQEKYRFCPYAIKGVRVEPNEHERLAVIDENTVELYNLLRNQFDRVVYIISKEFGIRAGGWFWRRALECFLNSEAYSFPWLTEANLPYLFAHLGMQHERIWKVMFRPGTVLYEALCQYPKIDFGEPNEYGYCNYTVKQGEDVDLYFRFYHYWPDAEPREELKESFSVCIDDGDEPIEVFEYTLKFNETSFQNLIRYGPKEKRQQWLLDIAAELMPDIQPNV